MHLYTNLHKKRLHFFERMLIKYFYIKNDACSTPLFQRPADNSPEKHMKGISDYTEKEIN